MVPPVQTPEEIQRRMAALRGALEQEVDGVVDSARTLSDWRYHFRAHPALFCAAAVVVGIVLAPRRGGGVEVSASSKPADPPLSEYQVAPARSLLAVALGLVGSALARQATQVAVRQGRELMERFLAARSAARERGASPHEEQSDQLREVS
jgi:hypothetical protein